MAAAVCSPASGTTRMLIRGIAAGRLVPLQQGVPALGISGFKRRFHVSPVSQGLKLRCYLRPLCIGGHF